MLDYCPNIDSKQHEATDDICLDNCKTTVVSSSKHLL